jgi:hypothetical protein
MLHKRVHNEKRCYITPKPLCNMLHSRIAVEFDKAGHGVLCEVAEHQPAGLPGPDHRPAGRPRRAVRGPGLPGAAPTVTVTADAARAPRSGAPGAPEETAPQRRGSRNNETRPSRAGISESSDRFTVTLTGVQVQVENSGSPVGRCSSFCQGRGGARPSAHSESADVFPPAGRPL